MQTYSETSLAQGDRARVSLVAVIALTMSIGMFAPAVVDAAEAIKGDGGTIRLLVNMSSIQRFPPAIMVKHGLDRKYGFKIETKPSVSTQTTSTALQTKSAEIAPMGWSDLSRLKAGGVKIVGVVPFLAWANTVIVPLDSPLATLADLKGKTVGVFNRRSLDWIVMRALAQRAYEFDLETGVNVQEGAVTLLRGLMEQGKLDATQMFADHTASMLLSGKYKVMATTRELVDHLGVPDAPFLLYAVDSDYAAAHPDNVRAWVAAYRESIEVLERDDAIWIELGRQELNQKDDAMSAAVRDRLRPMLMKSFAPGAEANIRKMWDILVATAGVENLGGMSKLVEGFMTLDYQ